MSIVYQYHPIADLFPMMDEQAFAELREDIVEHGLRELIVLHEGKILDGRNRYRACIEAEIEPEFVEYDGSDPLAYAISLNLKRRHLSESQRAMVAARLAKLERGRPAENPPIGGFKTDEASRLLNVGERSVERAKSVQRHAIPEVITAVEQGDMTVSAAAELAKERADIQTERMKLPTPKAAKKQALDTGKCVVSRDGMIQTPVPEAEMKAAENQHKIWWKLMHVFEELATIPTPEEVITTIPTYEYGNVNRDLPVSIEWLLRFKELWDAQK